MPGRFTSLENIIDGQAHRLLDALPKRGIYGSLVEFLVFGLKQGWACLFGGAMLFLIIGTHLYYPEDIALARYDFLFLAALAIQTLMLAARLETLDEAKVILIFHLVGTIMEIYKTYAGSWIYPEANFFRIGGVPMFSGFMYAAVGSYLARVSRLFDMQYTQYPDFRLTLALCAGIYINFFSHHYIWDFRWLLFGIIIVLYGRCFVHYRVFRHTHKMPMLLGFFLVALFIWLAENLGTVSRAWLYPNQLNGWAMVSPAKLGSWYLLMILSFVLVTAVHRPQKFEP
jgi:uncharacterized membrane protein YoaT (DUF817 family)